MDSLYFQGEDFETGINSTYDTGNQRVTMKDQIEKLAEEKYPIKLDTQQLGYFDENLEKRNIWIDGYTAAKDKPVQEGDLAMRIINNHLTCHCDEGYTSRGMKDPSCVLHQYDTEIELMMEEYTSQKDKPVGMMWVSVKDKLPDADYNFGEDEFGQFPVRFSFDNRTVIGLGYLDKDDSENPIHNAYNKKPFAAYDLEWLDESPSAEIEADSLAVGLLEWIYDEGFTLEGKFWQDVDGDKIYTHEQLLQLYKQSPVKALNIGEGKIDWEKEFNDYWDNQFKNEGSISKRIIIQWFKSRPEFK